MNPFNEQLSTPRHVTRMLRIRRRETPERELEGSHTPLFLGVGVEVGVPAVDNPTVTELDEHATPLRVNERIEPLRQWEKATPYTTSWVPSSSALILSGQSSCPTTRPARK